MLYGHHMKDILPDLTRWFDSGEPVAIATVVQTWGSSPRKVGAKMGVAGGGKMTGSVSGGCVEGAVVEEALDCLETGRPRLLHFGVADETAWEVGLACGGSIDVFVQRLDPAMFEAMREFIESDRPFAVLHVLEGPEGLIGSGFLVDRQGEVLVGSPGGELAGAADTARESLKTGRSGRVTLSPGFEAFVDVYRPAPELVIVGGVHIAVALAKFAGELGFRTTIVDPRRAFGSQERFPFADRLIQAWPDKALDELALTPNDAVAVLTHDPKLDDPALMVALPGEAFYVGALGSKGTQAKRRRRLLDAGLTEAQLDRLYGPIGLSIGAQTPEEIAISILAEIIAAKNESGQ